MPGRPLSRRAVLAGLGLLGVGAGSAALAETLPGGAGRVARELFPPDGPIGHVVRGRFDSRAVRRSVAHARRLQGIPVRLGCGRSDPFIAGNRRLGRLLGAQATTTFLPGGHSGRTWVHLRLHDLQFLGRHLS